jgi:hypothetical protein
VERHRHRGNTDDEAFAGDRLGESALQALIGISVISLECLHKSRVVTTSFSITTISPFGADQDVLRRNLLSAGNNDRLTLAKRYMRMLLIVNSVWRGIRAYLGRKPPAKAALRRRGSRRCCRPAPEAVSLLP